jgi:3-deoxy-manno-octulosonate cytidylyltransferase (CMP-KDO synthetase)
MRTLAVIPARLAASRLPRKPLRLLGGAPLIVRVWQRVSELGVADHIVVATDDDDVAGAVRLHGGEVVMTRSDHPSGTDRVAEAAARPEWAGFEVVVNVQGDEPFVSAAAVAGPAELVRQGRFPLATASARAGADILPRADAVKVVCDDSGRAMYFSRAPVPFLRDDRNRHLRDTLVRHHVGVYAYTREALLQWVGLPVHPLEAVEGLEQLRPLAAGMPMGVYELDAVPAGGVDTEEDLIRANVLWNDLYAGRT